MQTIKTQMQTPLNFLAAALLAVVALAGFAASGARAAAPAAGPGQIVFVAGKAEHCRMEACNNLDLVRSIGPHGGPGRILAGIRSVTETASTESGTIAVLSRVVAGGGANANAFTQVYLITPAGKRVAVFPHRLQGFNASGLGISGNGRTIALSGRFVGHYAEFETDRSQVWIVRSNGTGMHPVTSGPGSDEAPALSPDGKQVVFQRTLDDGSKAGRKPELYIASTAGGEARRLTENELEDVNPVFSPDGRSIAFGEVSAGRHRHGSIAVIRSDGTGLRTVTSVGREYPDPDYSPNGKNIAFIGEIPHAKGGYESAIYTVRASGTGRALVSGAFEFPALPQWTLRP